MKVKFTIDVAGGLLSWEQKELLEKMLVDPVINQRKSYEEYYHSIYNYPCELSYDDIDELSVFFRVEWCEGFHLYLGA